MARPTTKEQLLELGNVNFDKLFFLIESMSDQQQQATFAFEDRDRNIRDVLIHLYEWHQLLLDWINANQKGVSKSFLPELYNWKTYPAMNIVFWEKHQTTPLREAIVLIKQSHVVVMRIIASFTTEELFTKKYYSWTGSTSLGSYCVSSTSSHYDWAIKKIKQHHKTLS
ncbi:MAG: ClbS/DfsB family four-helix bundle protein [Flavobacteriaceae bacterium]|jgi:hypothetical protein|nr:ClbS/DfsB family four-helix bundle protein [Flavobacteriaceae bacterium]